ncbi:unnamed protein product, partial [Scytosiphon promiscuus]
HDQWYDTKGNSGTLIRQDSAFRESLSSTRLPAEKGRYHLYVSHACPWANRTTIFRNLKGLKDIITLTVVDALMLENGWTLKESSDPINGKNYLHEVYTLADPSYSGRVTVPVLWDKKEQTVVSNESAEIIRMFNNAFDSLTGNTADFYPESLRPEINEINELVYNTINNGVYKAGFATAQDVYEEEVTALFESLDVIEKRLEGQRYLIGNVVTEADWRLFTTLVRFDPVYVGHFKCNIRRIADYPNLSNYLRDLYQVDGVRETIHMDHIKKHYYASHTMINPTGIIPDGPVLHFDAPHNRDRFQVAQNS